MRLSQGNRDDVYPLQTRSSDSTCVATPAVTTPMKVCHWNYITDIFRKTEYVKRDGSALQKINDQRRHTKGGGGVLYTITWGGKFQYFTFAHLECDGAFPTTAPDAASLFFLSASARSFLIISRKSSAVELNSDMLPLLATAAAHPVKARTIEIMDVLVVSATYLSPLPRGHRHLLCRINNTSRMPQRRSRHGLVSFIFPLSGDI